MRRFQLREVDDKAVRVALELEMQPYWPGICRR